MPKPELEFFRPDHLPWTEVGGSQTGGAGGPGVMEKLLSRDERKQLARLTLRMALRANMNLGNVKRTAQVLDALEKVSSADEGGAAHRRSVFFVRLARVGPAGRACYCTA